MRKKLQSPEKWLAGIENAVAEELEIEKCDRFA